MVKTYVLLSTMDADAPVYQQLQNGQREKITRIPRHRPYMQITFQDANQKSKTIRYKANTDEIDQAVQIKDYKIEANEKFTQNERDNLWFRYGSLTTDKANLQAFLEAHPEFEGFKGTCDDVKRPCYKLLDKSTDAKIKNVDMKRRVAAGAKIVSLSLAEAEELLIRINGSYFEVPKTGDAEADLATCQNMLMEFMDDTNESGLNEILKEVTSNTVDENVKVLIGKLINLGELSFEQIPDAISKKGKDNNWIKLRDISASQYTPEERLRLFSDFLNTEDGKVLKVDLEKQLSDAEKKPLKDKIPKT